jgi:hypothetical protein
LELFVVLGRLSTGVSTADVRFQGGDEDELRRRRRREIEKNWTRKKRATARLQARDLA